MNTVTDFDAMIDNMYLYYHAGRRKVSSSKLTVHREIENINSAWARTKSTNNLI